MATKPKRLYELMLIIKANLTEERRNETIDKYKKIIEEFDGEVKNTIEWGRRKLKYPIEKLNEGYYYILYVQAPPSANKEIWEKFRLEEDLLRFMTTEAEEVRQEIKFPQLVKN
ncbi:MAG: 30S ribosomal protein S6 [Chlamydiia bacterium]|nr:30S ribosomal protein S6 [Chlamydiia bacterium]